MSTKTLGRYELATEIGQGPIGGLFRGRSENIEVLVRVFAQKSPFSEADGRALLEAARLAKGREHAALATLLDVVEEGDRLGFVYEGDGEPLTTLQKKTFSGRRDMPGPVVLRIVVELCSALSFAHKQAEEAGENLAFGGVTPDEIVVRPSGDAKLLGLFTAPRAGAVGPIAAMPRRAAFQAPEHFRNEPLSARSDVFSVAALAWELSLNRPLFGSLNLAEVKRRVLGDVKRADAGRIGKDGVSKAVADVLEKALKNNPEDRYASMDELKAALEEAGGALASPAEVAAFVDLLLGRPTEKAPISVPKPSARLELKKPDISQKFEIKKPEASSKPQLKKPEIGKSTEPQTPAPSETREPRERLVTEELSMDDIEFPAFDAATLKAAGPSKPPPPPKRPGTSTPPPAKLPVKAEVKAAAEDPEKSGVVSKPASSVSVPSGEIEVDLPSEDDWAAEPKAPPTPAAERVDGAGPAKALETANEESAAAADKPLANTEGDAKPALEADDGNVPVPVISEVKLIVAASPAAATENQDEPATAQDKDSAAVAVEEPVAAGVAEKPVALEMPANEAPPPVEKKPLAPALPLIAPSASAFSAANAEAPQEPQAGSNRARLAIFAGIAAVLLIAVIVVMAGSSDEPPTPANVAPQATEVVKAPEPPPAAETVATPPPAAEPTPEPSAQPAASAPAPEPVAANPAPPAPTQTAASPAAGATKTGTPAKTAKPGAAKPGGAAKPKPGDKKYIPQGI